MEIKRSNVINKIALSVIGLSLSLGIFGFQSTQNSNQSLKRTISNPIKNSLLTKESRGLNSTVVASTVIAIASIAVSAVGAAGGIAINIQSAHGADRQKKQFNKIHNTLEEIRKVQEENTKILKSVDEKLNKTNQLLENNNKLLQEFVSFLKQRKTQKTPNSKK